jgi:hypothetical protein
MPCMSCVFFSSAPPYREVTTVLYRDNSSTRCTRRSKCFQRVTISCMMCRRSSLSLLQRELLRSTNKSHVSAQRKRSPASGSGQEQRLMVRACHGWLLAVGATHHLAHTCTLVRLTPVESSVVSPVLFNYLQILVSAVLFIWLKLFRQFVIFVGWARG